MPKTLPIQMQHTDATHDQWCWAAVAASVADFKDHAAHKQCDVASLVLNIPDCCGSGSCNVPAELNEALSAVHHFNYSSAQSSDFGEVRDQIDLDRPLGVRIGWSGGGVGHFVTVSGYDETTQWVVVDDPLYGRSSLPHAEFRNSYKNLGSWTDSYFTV